VNWRAGTRAVERDRGPGPFIGPEDGRGGGGSEV
jgi:hypothetical protein